MTAPFAFRRHEEQRDEPETPPAGNAGQPDAEAARLERLREHTRVAIEDLGRLRSEVETKTLKRFSEAVRGVAGLPARGLRLDDAERHLGAPEHGHADATPGGWHAVGPGTVDALWVALDADEVGPLLFTLLERVDELQGVVEWLVERIEPVLAQAERTVERHAHAGHPGVDYQALDAPHQAVIDRLLVLGAALDLALAMRLLQDDGSLVPGQEAWLEQVRRAAQ